MARKGRPKVVIAFGDIGERQLSDMWPQSRLEGRPRAHVEAQLHLQLRTGAPSDAPAVSSHLSDPRPRSSSVEPQTAATTSEQRSSRWLISTQPMPHPQARKVEGV